MTDLVTATLAAVDYDAWVTTDDGDRIPQSSAPHTIEAMLRLLDVRPGQRVMEIGTGSGYTGALLAHAVGQAGRVVSLDVDAQLVERAAERHEQAGNRHVEVHGTDGFAGWPTGGPYERIVGWATPHVLPRAWVDQAANDGVIVTPVKLAPVAAANALVRCHVIDGRPGDGSLHPGSFIEMAAEVITDFGTPVRYVDAVSQPRDDTPPTWLSATRLHGEPNQVVQRLLHKLEAAEPQPGPVDPADEMAFTAFLLAATVNTASAGTPHGRGLGVATLNSVAVMTGGAILAAGSAEASDELTALHTRWAALGKPGHADLAIAFLRADDGWLVRADYGPPAVS